MILRKEGQKIQGGTPFGDKRIPSDVLPPGVSRSGTKAACLIAGGVWVKRKECKLE